MTAFVASGEGKTRIGGVGRRGALRLGIGLTLVVLSIVASIVSFLILLNLTPIVPTDAVVTTLLVIDGVLILGVLAAVIVEAWALFRARRQRRAGAGLHLRIVALVGLTAAIPAIFAAVAFAVALDRGLDRWFEPRMSQVVASIGEVSDAWRDELRRSLAIDLSGIALTLPYAEPARVLETEVGLRRLIGAFIFDQNGRIVVSAEGQEGPAVVPDAAALTEDMAFVEANPTTVANRIFETTGETDAPAQVAGLARLPDTSNLGTEGPTYLYVVRAIEAVVPPYIRAADAASQQIGAYMAQRGERQLIFTLTFSGLTLAILLGAVWVGIIFANGLVAPIRRLMSAAGEVARGNLLVTVPTRGRDDLDSLGDSFNTMTAQLRSQRTELLTANDELDQRRRFTEAVLSGVTAGVLGVSGAGEVTLANRSACALLDRRAEEITGRPLAGELPEIEPLLAAAMHDDSRTFQGVVTLLREGRERTVSVRVASDGSADGAHGYVVTLDDITDLVSAQRTSAWADVARRIAHEIKNPLTPIQLSAERIRRRYGKAVGEDRRIFDQCVDTIIRQVGDIGRMVEEFSSFARMPKPAMEERDFAETIREAVFLMSVGHPEFEFVTDLPDGPMMGRFDHRLMSQVVTNLVKNAAEAIQALPPDAERDGRVEVRARAEGDRFVMDVIDNGIGLPQDNRQRLLEPYVTTREKGTGLGLAIVAKIIEEHEGKLELADSPAVARGGRGAVVHVTFPRAPSLRGALDKAS